MMKTTFALLMMLVLAAASLCCTAEKPEDAPGDPTAVVAGNTAFAIDLYGQLRERDGNLFFSPYSVSTALAMTYAGANGQTAEEMARTLHFALAQPQLHASLQALQTKLTGADPKRPFQLFVANALWGQQGYHFQADFLSLTQSRYGAGLRELDFAGNKEQARQIINEWVEKQTQAKIKDLLQPGIIDELTRLVLTNAIYFKAGWESPFNEEATKPDPFFLAADHKVNVPLMHKMHEFNYLDGGEFQALELPYMQHELSMLVFLPKKADGLAAFGKTLTGDNLKAWLPKMKAHQVDTTLPKFKFAAEFELKKTLAGLGMTSAFSRARADFSGMTGRPDLYITAVVHKAFVDVNEQGTEAAAATAVVLGERGAAPAPLPKATFRADHPFVFAIRDNSTGSILFLGRVTNPQG